MTTGDITFPSIGNTSKHDNIQLCCYMMLEATFLS